MSRPSFAWLPTASPAYLLGCWLRAQPPGTPVVVLAPPALRDVATAELGTAPNLSGEVAVVTPGVALPASLAAQVTAQEPCRVTVPLALDHVPMRYRDALMPDLTPHGPLLRQLWQWGFCEVHFAGLRGGHTIPVPHMLEAFHNRHQGRRCFVVGNGPSLNDIDMTRLRDEITLGSNRCFLGYETWGFPFTYWGVYDKYQIEQYHPAYEAGVPADTVKFFPLEYLPALRVEHGCPIQSVWPQGAARAFSAAPDKTYVGFTVTYMLLQIAATMGCDPIILIGADHRYELTRRGYSRAFRSARRALTRRLRGGRLYETALAARRAWRKGASRSEPALWGTETAASATHFTAAYTDGGKNRFLPPEPEEAERDFNCAHAWALAQGRQILNATPRSALDSFPRIDFDSLF